MILTGPEIRRQIALGKTRHEKKRTVIDRPPARGGRALDVLVSREIIDDKMNYIDVEPYVESLVGPNSIDLRLGGEVLVYKNGFQRHSFYESENARYKKDRQGNLTAYMHGTSADFPCMKPVVPLDSILDMKAGNETHALEIPEDGLILWPGVLYLGRTVEAIGSNAFVPIVEGRSSVGRLGIHVHVTAGFCDLGFRGTITLEIHVIHPVRIYPWLPICQAYFLEPRGEIELYKGRYQNQVEPVASRFGMKVERDDE